MAGFDDNPILNSPYFKPTRHWELDDEGRPVHQDEPNQGRRESKYILPVPAPDQKQGGRQAFFGFTTERKKNDLVNEIRKELEAWKGEQVGERGITDTTESLLKHWRSGVVQPRLFFCQLEAVETLIWLNEVAPTTDSGKKILQKIRKGNGTSNTSLFRIACKMATGSGKTTVMALLIAYHACNADRNPDPDRFAQNFLIITPGITVRERLKVLTPTYKENYYEEHQFLPQGWMDYVKQAKVVITNYHKFGRREVSPTKAAQEVLQGQLSEKSVFVQEESNKDILKRVWDSQLPKEKVLVINDEAHHCYRNRELSEEEIKRIHKKRDTDERKEAKQNSEAAHLWINGIEDLEKETGLHCVYDLSATPTFLDGSGWPKETLFPWVASDFSLVDAIESGIVKIPRLPVRDDTKAEYPKYRDLYQLVKEDLRKNKGKQYAGNLPDTLRDALVALYQNYVEVAEKGEAAAKRKKQGTPIPPVFIIVCNDTKTSDWVFRTIAGYQDKKTGEWIPGKYNLNRFSNVDEDTGEPHPEPRTILVDSLQMEAGGTVSDEFKALAQDIKGSGGKMRQSDVEFSTMTNEQLLREVLNTVGKKGYLGEQIRCVVSVSMLTEGWDAQNVTHILGVRAFGTQLLCEQVVGRALRRRNYKRLVKDDEGRLLYPPEYADVFGIPFSFAQGSQSTTSELDHDFHVCALSDRADMEIEFPLLQGYRIAIENDRLRPDFSKGREMFEMKLNADGIPAEIIQDPLKGQGIRIKPVPSDNARHQEVAYYFAGIIAKTDFADKEGRVAPQRVQDLIHIADLWMKDYVSCKAPATIAFLRRSKYEDRAISNIVAAAISSPHDDERRFYPTLSERNPTGTSVDVRFNTGEDFLFETTKSHVNFASCDNSWEEQMCAALEAAPSVLHYVYNDLCRGGLKFSVPYTFERLPHWYHPDFIAVIDDGHGPDDPLHLVIEVKGERDDRDAAKADTMNIRWVPAVNNDGRWGRWAFIEMHSPQYFKSELRRIARGDV